MTEHDGPAQAINMCMYTAAAFLLHANCTGDMHDKICMTLHNYIFPKKNAFVIKLCNCKSAHAHDMYICSIFEIGAIYSYLYRGCYVFSDSGAIYQPAIGCCYCLKHSVK